MAEIEEVLTNGSPPQASEAKPAQGPRSLTDIIASHIETLKTHHNAVLATQDVEAIHKMRVTTRRLQAALDLLGGEIKVRAMKNQLRKWRRALSRVRNYDVFLMLLEKEAQARRGAHREQFELIMTRLQEKRARRAAKVHKLLERIDIDSIARKLGLSAPAPSVESNETDSADVGRSERGSVIEPGDKPQFDQAKIASHAADRLDQRVAEFLSLAAASHPTTDPAELHELRIAAKRVRYILELVSDMGYGRPIRPLAWLRTLQDRIGDWHDLHALEEEIIEIVSHVSFMREHLAESSRMLEAAAHLQKKKESLETKLFPVRVPRTAIVTSQRISRAMRRYSTRNQARVKRTSRPAQRQNDSSAEQ